MNNLIEKINKSIDAAERGESKLSLEILNMKGLSGPKHRNFLNNIIDSSTRYLEVGTWTGSTLISALYKNSPEFHIGIDNFTIFCENGDRRAEFHANCKTHLGYAPNFLDQNCWDVSLKDNGISEINFYLYDGCHKQRSQEKAITHFSTGLADEFILMVDDWNEESARIGTIDGLKKSGIEMVYRRELFTEKNAVKHDWWNGLLVAACKKI
jgi:hypothetical protein